MRAANVYIGMILSLLSISVFTSGCSDDYEYSTDYSQYDGVTLGIDLVDQSNVLNLNLISGTYTLKINVAPESIVIDPKGYIYELEDETVATVNEEGVITMLKEGETKLTVKFRGNQNISTSCTVRISPILTEELNVPESIIVEEEKTVNLAEAITTVPTEASKKFIYQVDDESIATIDEEGIITGVSEGTTNIVVTTTDGTNLSDNVTVHVVGKIYISDIVFPVENVEGKSFVVGQKLNLAKFVNILPVNASEPVVKYTVVSGSEYASVSEDGIVTFSAAGDVTIQLEAGDNNPTPIEPTTINFKTVANGWHERSLWTVDTSYKFEYGGTVYNYVIDTSAGGNPEMMFDGKENTWLRLAKPGKSYPVNGIPFEGSEGDQFFIVDLGDKTKFSKFKWGGHSKADNSVWAVSLYGSDDGVNFDNVIKENFVLTRTGLHEYDLQGDFEYRYIKAKFEDWDDSKGLCFIISEFNISN